MISSLAFVDFNPRLPLVGDPIVSYITERAEQNGSVLWETMNLLLRGVCRQERMHIRRGTVTAAVVLSSIVGAAVLAASSAARRQDPTSPVTPPQQVGGIVAGTALRADNTPLPAASVRLREVADGRAMGWAKTDGRGEFRFEQVPPGEYIVELVSQGEAVVAVSGLVALRSPESVLTSVRASSRAPWFIGFIGNAAAGVIAGAASLGITAMGSNGAPASPQ